VLTSFTTPTYLISTLTGNSSNIGVGQGKWNGECPWSFVLSLVLRHHDKNIIFYGIPSIVKSLSATLIKQRAILPSLHLVCHCHETVLKATSKTCEHVGGTEARGSRGNLGIRRWMCKVWGRGTLKAIHAK
jgi:hypothetical protein